MNVRQIIMEIKMKIKSILGLKGSWSWALRQMKKGNIVHRSAYSGSCRYKLSEDGQQRIMQTFGAHGNIGEHRWQSAYLFLNDFDCTDWALWRS